MKAKPKAPGTKKLIRQLLASGWTLTTLADRLGVSYSQVSRWANGRVAPHPLNLAALRSLLPDPGMKP